MKLDTNINYEGRGKERENLKNLLHFSLNLAWKKRKKERKEERSLNHLCRRETNMAVIPASEKGREEKWQRRPTMETKKHGPRNWQIVQGGGGNGS